MYLLYQEKSNCMFKLANYLSVFICLINDFHFKDSYRKTIMEVIDIFFLLGYFYTYCSILKFRVSMACRFKNNFESKLFCFLHEIVLIISLGYVVEKHTICCCNLLYLYNLYVFFKPLYAMHHYP